MSDTVTGGLWRGGAPLVLASSSRTRAGLLAEAGLPIEAVAPQVDERALEAEAAGLAPADLALRLAEVKAREVARRRPGRIILGADQVLDLEGHVFHKPADLEEARVHLARLQGRTHALHSAVAIVRDGKAETFFETARLTMRPLDPAAIAAYVALAGAARVTASVGAYQLEGLGIHLFTRVEGDHSTVLGLPLLPLLARLRAMGVLAF